MRRCTCGHAEDEHGLNPNNPESTACTVKDCGCVAFENDPTGEPEPGLRIGDEPPDVA